MFLKTAMPSSETAMPILGNAAKALPKVNIPPVTPVQEPAAANGHDAFPAAPVQSEFEPQFKKPGFTWDFKFSLGLIILVITVNTALAMLLGKAGDLKNSAAMQIFAEPQEQRTIPLQKSPEQLQAIAPAAGLDEKSQTRTYISPEDKRVLLKYLETPPDQRPLSAPNTIPDSNR